MYYTERGHLVLRGVSERQERRADRPGRVADQTACGLGCAARPASISPFRGHHGELRQ
jgi:hypothetical protein